MYLIRDRSYNFEETWKFLDRVYSLNNGIYNGLSRFSSINGAILKLMKYSATSFIPYDLSKVNEILEAQEHLYKQANNQEIKI
jgi:hypothetical protein